MKNIFLSFSLKYLHDNLTKQWTSEFLQALFLFIEPAVQTNWKVKVMIHICHIFISCYLMLWVFDSYLLTKERIIRYHWFFTRIKDVPTRNSSLHLLFIHILRSICLAHSITVSYLEVEPASLTFKIFFLRNFSLSFMNLQILIIFCF